MTALAKAETTISAELDLRADYERLVWDLSTYASDLRRMSLAPEAIARQLHAARRALVLRFKAMTPEPTRRLLCDRTMRLYGDCDGPTIDYLRAQGKTGDQIIEFSLPVPDTCRLSAAIHAGDRPGQGSDHATDRDRGRRAGQSRAARRGGAGRLRQKHRAGAAGGCKRFLPPGAATPDTRRCPHPPNHRRLHRCDGRVSRRRRRCGAMSPASRPSIAPPGSPIRAPPWRSSWR